jgi:sugar O-acyltransferase (sialic acid O-acetyltransferase NeuD family)
MHDVIIVGAGAFAREVFQMYPACFPDQSLRLKGFLSKSQGELQPFGIDLPILGDPEQYQPAANDRFLLAIGQIDDRKRVVLRLKQRGAQFLTMIHPTAHVDPSARLGEGVMIYPFATVMNHAVIGDFVLMNIHASAGHDTRIGSFGNLSPYATTNGFCVLEDEVFLGTHASVLAYRRVGLGSKVSANSVAAHDVQPRTLVFGVPGKHVPILPGGGSN